MNLVVNSLAAFESSLGIRRYSLQILRCLHTESPIEFYTPPPLGPFRRAAELAYRGHRDRILWSPAQRGPLWAHHHVVTVHDCINVEYVYREDWRLPVFRRLFQQILDQAEAIVTISRSTLNSLDRNYRIDHTKTKVISSPLDVGLRPDPQVQAPLGKPFILMVTNALPHKNTLRACSALARCEQVRRNLELRIVGSLTAEALTACRNDGLDVTVHRGVDEATLARWYAQASFLFSPSLEEGHNLPVAEALGCGGRVLCSDIPVHHEFYEGMVRFCDPKNIDQMACCVEQALGLGTWNHTRAPDYPRSFKEVAEDYERLFASLTPGRKEI